MCESENFGLSANANTKMDSTISSIHHTLIILRLFHIICVVTVLVLAYCQLQLFMDNKDQSAVGYKRFNNEKDDIYPAISVCLHSLHGAIFNEDNHYVRGVGGPKKYREILLGNESIAHKFSDNVFSNSTKNLFEDFVVLFFTMTKQGEIIGIWDRNMQGIYPSFEYAEPHPFFKSYQAPNLMCMTKRVDFIKDQILNFESLVFNASSLYNSNIENLLLYMHQAGQLTKQIGKQILRVRRSDFMNAMNESSNYYKILINQVEVLRKRPDAIVPCNDTLQNEDKMWREMIITKVGCIPDYWLELHQDSNLKDNHNTPLQKCTKEKEFKLIAENFLPSRHTDNGTKLYIGPCKQMGITVSVGQSDLKEKHLVLDFSYVIEEYRETYNMRAFSYGSLWSTIGGFIGMILGCGLLQVFL